jgi:methionyl-tRNA formyltransferase
MRCTVFAYHDIGYVCLRELLRAGATVSAVITHEDDPNETVWFRSVAHLAAEHGLPVCMPPSVNSTEWTARIAADTPDFIFSFYYRKVLSPEVLASARRGALNLHGSLLPKYRGRCPVNWVLIHGERETGVTLHYMEEKPDRGDIVAQRTVPITDGDTALTLYRKLTAAAAVLVRETYPLLVAGTARRTPQDHTAATYFGGRRPDDGRIDWAHPGRALLNLVRAVTHPYPGAFGFWEDRKLYVWEAHPSAGTEQAAVPPGTVLSVSPAVRVQTGTEPIELTRLQLESEPELAAARWAEQHALREGVRLT